LSGNDVMYSYQHLGLISMKITFFEAGWMLSGLLIILGLTQHYSEEKFEFRKPFPSIRRLNIRIESILPIMVSYIVLGFVLLDWWLSGEPDRVALSILVLLAVLLLTRQGAIAGQSEIRKHAELVNSTADFAFIFDSKGAILLANPALQAFLGSGTDQKSAMNVREFLYADFSLEDLLGKESDLGWFGEAQLNRINGKVIPISLSIKPIVDEQRGEVLFAAIAHDLTEAKRREDELRNALQQLAETEEDLRRLNRELEAKVEDRTQELEDMVSHLAQLNEDLKALDKLKSDFVALVSHELRAPLTNIQTGLEVLLKRTPELKQHAVDSMSLILKETERLSSFVEMILDLSAIEAGKLHLQIRPVLPNEIVDEVYLQFSNKSGSDRIRINMPEVIPPISADRQAFYSILFHLIDNALKYASEGEVILSISEEESRIVFGVGDSGPGIPEQEREHVFEMFYRLDASDSQKVYGRGLGLNLAKRFLDLMDGGIQILQSDTGGTLVEFWLPKNSEGE